MPRGIVTVPLNARQPCDVSASLRARQSLSAHRRFAHQEPEKPKRFIGFHEFTKVDRFAHIGSGPQCVTVNDVFLFARIVSNSSPSLSSTSRITLLTGLGFLKRYCSRKATVRAMRKRLTSDAT